MPVYQDNSPQARALIQELRGTSFGQNIVFLPEGGGESALWSDNLAGFLIKDGEEHHIVSRFSQAGTFAGDHFFSHMLSKAMPEFALLKAEVASQSTRTDLLPIYAAIFAGMLKSALQKGVMKEYVRRACNDSNVRGVIDVPRHIRQNTPFLGKVAYTQREHSTDNALTQLIRHAAESLGAHPGARPWLDRVAPEVRQIREVTPGYRRGDAREVIERNRNKPVRHAYFAEYRDLQKVCLQVLQYQYQVYGGSQRGMQGVLFDCAALWEEYLAVLLSGKFHHPDNRKRTGGQRLFDRGVSIYPDLISTSEPRVVADAKYKSAYHEENDERDNEDFYQILTYMLRFGPRNGPLKGLLLYPCKSVRGDEGHEPVQSEYRLRQGADLEGAKSSARPEDDAVTVVKLALRVPSQVASAPDGGQYAVPYEQFQEEMQKSEEAFVACVEKIVEGAAGC